MVNSLYLNRLLVYPSEKEIDVTFRKGLNIILAKDAGTENNNTRNSVGKSTFIDLINYGLGKENFLADDKKAAKDRMELMQLYLEFSIGEKRYTIQRGIINGQLISIYENWVINDLINGYEIDFKIKEVKEYCSFLESEIFQEQNIFNNKKLVSWRQIISMLLRNQVGGFQDLAQPATYYENAQVKRKRIEFLLNLLTPQKTELEIQQSVVSEETSEKQKSYNVIMKYARHQLKVTEVELQSQIRNIKEEINSHEEMLSKYKQELVNINKTQDLAIQRRSKLVQEMMQLNQDINIHFHRIKNYGATINEIQGELQKIDIAQSATHIFNRYGYKQCPTCLRPFLPEDAKECAHTISQVSDQSVRLIKKVLSNERLELIDATSLHRSEIDRLENSKQELQQMINIIDHELKKDVNGILEMIDYKESEIKILQRELNNLNNLFKINSDVDSYYLDWQSAKDRLSGINKSIATIQKEVDKRLTYFKELVNEVVGFLYSNSRIGMLKRSERKGNFSLDIKHKELTEGIDDGAASFTIRVIAFDLALLKLAALQDTNHPKFLIHDSPNVRDIDPKVYRRIFSFIIQLENDLMEKNDTLDFQYIITTIDIPDELEESKFVRLTLDNTGEKGKLFGFTY
ncbi:DUF2326 domain-containing protein [Paenibacillus jamilae]|uniref:DUF2326 domain-containing protein n=1 Tax=Paenibacillus TaxID=44249 RepID=UPI00077CB6C4|nr:DUF2326 domain-containing protein [Paenibacillus polymyxa]KYG93729.1 hypothetical protein AZE31_07730 [Paenibacillus polymyxa]